MAAGMWLAFDLSVALNLCAQQAADRCKSHLQVIGLPSGQASLPASNAPANILLDHMKRDKKTRNGVMHFVLARAIGDSFVQDDVPEAVVTKLLERGFNAV